MITLLQDSDSVIQLPKELRLTTSGGAWTVCLLCGFLIFRPEYLWTTALEYNDVKSNTSVNDVSLKLRKRSKMGWNKRHIPSSFHHLETPFALKSAENNRSLLFQAQIWPHYWLEIKLRGSSQGNTVLIRWTLTSAQVNRGKKACTCACPRKLKKKGNKGEYLHPKRTCWI